LVPLFGHLDLLVTDFVGPIRHYRAHGGVSPL